MARGVAHIQIEGYREFQRELRNATDAELPKAIGQVHKQIGTFIISRLSPPPDPEAIGYNTGKIQPVRPTATRREVLLKAGGAYRAKGPPHVAGQSGTPWAYKPWGKKYIKADKGSRRPPRPYIVKTALSHEREIRQMLLDGVTAALSGAFWKAE